MSLAGGGEQFGNGANEGGIEYRQIALQIDDDIMRALRIDRFKRGEHAVRSRRQIRIGEDGAAAGARDHRNDFGLGGRDQDGAEPGCDRLPPDALDHRDARNIGQRLVGKPRRRQPRGNDHNRIHRFRLFLRFVYHLCDASPQ